MHDMMAMLIGVFDGSFHVFHANHVLGRHEV